MRQIKITAGPHTSVQDFGRIGHQALGVPEGGFLTACLCGWPML